MHPPAEPKFEDDASGEAWFQKGVTLLHGRNRERAEDELLRRAMARSILQEWQAWLAFMIGVLALFQAHHAASSLIVGPHRLRQHHHSDRCHRQRSSQARPRPAALDRA